MANISEYERGYKDGAKDCQALYGRILDHICMALDEKGEKEQAKKSAGWDRAKSMTFFVCSNFYENVAILKRPQARRRNVI